MAESLENQVFALADGRTLGFAENGDPLGTPVFFFHGFPGSRIEGRMWHVIGCKLNARIITPDRPGFGLSSLHPGRTFTQWACDVAELATHLRISKYHVLGASGGGPYALACAYIQPEALLGVGIVAGSGPYADGTVGVMPAQRAALWLMSWSPALVRPFMGPIVKAAQDPDPAVIENMLLKAMESFSEKDRAFLADDDERKTAVETLREAYRQGTDGWTVEAWMVTKPWDFKIEDIKMRGISFWYGTADVHTPVSMGRKMAERLKEAVFYVFDQESHFTIANRSEEILKMLLTQSEPKLANSTDSS